MAFRRRCGHEPLKQSRHSSSFVQLAFAIEVSLVFTSSCADDLYQVIAFDGQLGFITLRGVQTLAALDDHLL